MKHRDDAASQWQAEWNSRQRFVANLQKLFP
jgi:hypothetical protein